MTSEEGNWTMSGPILVLSPGLSGRLYLYPNQKALFHRRHTCVDVYSTSRNNDDFEVYGIRTTLFNVSKVK